MGGKRVQRINSERCELIRLTTFMVLTTRAISCNSILSLKRELRAHSASLKVYRNASIRLALGPSYPKAFGAIKGQHMVLIAERDISEVCKLVVAFISSNGSHLHAFVWDNALYRTECVSLIARSVNGAALKSSVLASLKRVLSRFAIALALPLINFASLLAQALNRCPK